MLTLVELNHSALLPECTNTLSRRTEWNGLSSLWAAIGSCSVFIAHYTWHTTYTSNTNINYFWLFCFLLSFISIILVEFTFIIFYNNINKISQIKSNLKQLSQPLPYYRYILSF